MARERTCVQCGVPTLNGYRCTRHAGGGPGKRDRRYDDRAWRKLRDSTLREHRARVGDMCPGYRRPPHATADLTVDHVTPMSHGGPITGRVQVLCRSCNTRKSHDDSPRRGR